MMTEHLETNVEALAEVAEVAQVVAEPETTAESSVVENSSTEENNNDSSATEVEAVAEDGTGMVEASAEVKASAEVEPTESASAEAEPAPETSIEAEPAAEASAETDSQDDDETPVVRMLSVGQRVIGTVRRITDFGAFVDIGVGRDGLIHVSELSVRRIGKVTDMLQESQEIEVWIKKLDRDRNRISLTMIEPGTKTIRDLEKGELVKGIVTRILPYGAFVDIGIGRDALLHIREMSEGYVAKPEDVVTVGEELEARVIELSRRRQRVDLSVKGLRPEPEVELAPEEAAAAAAEQAEQDVVDEYADMEVLSPMELAFKRAMEAGGTELASSSTEGKKKHKKGNRSRSLQDEIIARTLGVANN